MKTGLRAFTNAAITQRRVKMAFITMQMTSAFKMLKTTTNVTNVTNTMGIMHSRGVRRQDMSVFGINALLASFLLSLMRVKTAQ